jgi:hypothetical protein
LSALVYYVTRRKRHKTASFISNALENLNVTNDTGRPCYSVSNVTTQPVAGGAVKMTPCGFAGLN